MAVQVAGAGSANSFSATLRHMLLEVKIQQILS